MPSRADQCLGVHVVGLQLMVGLAMGNQNKQAPSVDMANPACIIVGLPLRLIGQLRRHPRRPFYHLNSPHRLSSIFKHMRQPSSCLLPSLLHLVLLPPAVLDSAHAWLSWHHCLPGADVHIQPYHLCLSSVLSVVCVKTHPCPALSSAARPRLRPLMLSQLASETLSSKRGNRGQGCRRPVSQQSHLSWHGITASPVDTTEIPFANKFPISRQPPHFRNS